MKRYLKRFSVVSVVSLLAFLQILFLMPIQSAHAGVAKDIDKMCVPPVSYYDEDFKKDTSGDNKAQRFKPRGDWVTVRFLNRQTVRVEITPEGKKCGLKSNLESDDSLDLKFISESDIGGGSTKRLLEGILRDSNTSDSFWDYKQYGNGDNKDDAVLRNFTKTSELLDATKDPFGLNSGIVDTSTIRDSLQTTHLILSWDNAQVTDDVANCKKNGDDNNNFVLYAIDAKLQWGCESRVPSSANGLSVWDNYVDLDNFNVTFAVVGSGEETRIISTRVLQLESTGGIPTNPAFANATQDAIDLLTFQLCPNGKFQNANCGGALEIDVTLEDLEGNASGIVDANLTDGTTRSPIKIAGVASESTTILTNVNQGLAAGESCESEGGAFSFVICPLLRFSDGAVASLDGRIFDALQIDSDYYEDSRLRDSWARLRNIGYVLLIPIMLIMVIGTALGFSFVDAYTVKRALPRLFAAIIFMALSFDVGVIMIEITNGIGQGAAGLVAQPFGGLDNMQLTDLFSPNPIDDTLLLAGGFTFVAVGFVGIGIIASYLFVIALILLGIFLILALRRVLIIALLLLGPLAIISWIFPGNDKLWKLWWNTFSKLLMIFPVILMLLVTGRIFASLVDNVESGLFATIIKLTAFVGPYFLIPAAFRFVGGAFGNLAGMVNDRGKGLLDRQRQYRSNKRKQNWEDAKAGNRFRGTNRISRRASKLVQYGTNAPRAFDAGMFKPGSYAQSLQNAIGDKEHSELGKVKEENPAAASLFKDDFVTGASLHDTEAEIRAALQARDANGNLIDERFADEQVTNAAVQRIIAAKRASGDTVYKKAAVQALAEAGTYYKDAAHLARTVNEVYGDDRQNAGAALMAASSASMQAGRVDLGGAGAGTKLGTLTQLYNGDITEAELNQIVHRDVIDSQAASTISHASMKPGFVETNLIPEFQRRIQEAYATGDQSVVERELATVANMYDTMSATNPKLGEIFADEVMSISPGPLPAQAGSAYRPLAPGSAGPVLPSANTVREQIELVRGNDEFRNRRREYGSSADEAQANQPRGGPGAGPTTPAAGGGPAPGP